jgi:cell volume regulation protein A
VVTVALVAILFDGGIHIGWSRFRSAAGPIAVVGVAGTFLTVGRGGVLAISRSAWPGMWPCWWPRPWPHRPGGGVLRPRPAEIEGRSDTILEGESGANDPVGIALMASLITAGGLSAGALGQVGEFLLQMVIGAAKHGAALPYCGSSAGCRCPARACYPLRTLTCALLLYGIATLAHGSGFPRCYRRDRAGDARALQARDRAIS